MTIGMTMIIAIHMAMIMIIVDLPMAMNGMDVQNTDHRRIDLLRTVRLSIDHLKVDLQRIVRRVIDLIVRTINRLNLCHINAGSLCDGRSFESIHSVK